MPTGGPGASVGERASAVGVCWAAGEGAGLGVRRGEAGMAETDWAGASGQARKRSGARWLGLGRAGWPRASERVGPRETMGRVEVWADILG